MKKLFTIGCLLLGFIGAASCENNEGESIDLLTPNDSTRTAISK
ncbi:MAG: hypothetical protein AAGA86_02605 [Bacteroidota bacterium]